MTYRHRLEGLSRPVLVEVVYLAGRYLSHGARNEAFLRQLEADVRTKYSQASRDTVLAIMSDIEKQEGKPIAELPASRRHAIAAELDDVMWEDIDKQTSPTEADAALAGMRSGY